MKQQGAFPSSAERMAGALAFPVNDIGVSPDPNDHHSSKWNAEGY